MKKRTLLGAIALAVLAVIATLTCCILLKPTAISLIRDMGKELGKVRSATAGVSIEYEGTVAVQGVGVNVGMKADLDMETMGGTAHEKGTVSVQLPIVGSMSVPVESYQETSDNELVIYSTLDGSSWTKTRSSAEGQPEDSSFQLDGKAVLGILEKIKAGEIQAELAEETEKIGDKEVYREEITIGGSLLQQVILAAGTSENGGSGIPDGLDLTGADARITLYIDKNTKLPARAVFDCTALGSAAMKSLIQDDRFESTAKKFVITIDFREFNTLESLEVPEKVKSSAVEAESGGAGLFDNLLPGGIS